MRSRRRFLQLSFAALLASAARAVWINAERSATPLLPGSAPALTPVPAAPEPPRVPQPLLLPLILSHEAPAATPFVPAAAQADQQIYIPLLRTSPPPLIGAPLLGP